MVEKKFLKSKPICQATFYLPETIEATEACVVGEFNNWDQSANPLRKTKGVWKTTLKLNSGQEYQFKYVVNGGEWHNDDQADKYVPDGVAGENSVLVAIED